MLMKLTTGMESDEASYNNLQQELNTEAYLRQAKFFLFKSESSLKL